MTTSIHPGETTAGFEIVTALPASLRGADPYTAAQAFVAGELEVEGDLVEAVRQFLASSRHGWRSRLLNLVGRVAPWRLLQQWGSAGCRANNIRFHYDRSNDFYACFLDRGMVYSCAYFRHPGDSLDDAQQAKLDLVCRKLRLGPGQRLLDIGSGWGGLVRYAAKEYGALATGCTLSDCQARYAQQAISQEGLFGAATIREMDYLDLGGHFDKIASIGMFEHVGRRHLDTYLRKAHDLLEPHGLFLNHGITRPASVPSDSQSMFVARRVFPGGETLHLGDVISAAERVGFEILDVENLRRHYALTCRAWVKRLRERREECLRHVDAPTWRTWQLYLAGSAVAFEEGTLGLHQILMAKRGANQAAPMIREDLYEARPAMRRRRMA